MELITVNNNTVGLGQIQTVNARELHGFLEVRKDFSDWIKVQIDRARLLEDRDYVVLPQKGENPYGGRPTVDYHITLDAAKHISMVSGTEKGWEVREYFIAVEKRYQEQTQVPPPSYAESLIMLGQSMLDNERLTLENQEMLPKVTYANEVLDKCKGLISLTDFGKSLKTKGFPTGAKKIFVQLRAMGIIRMFNPLPYDEYMGRGHFEIKVSHKEARTDSVTFLTPKGEVFVLDKLKKYLNLI